LAEKLSGTAQRPITRKRIRKFPKKRALGMNLAASLHLTSRESRSQHDSILLRWCHATFTPPKPK
jgi:hypothetical protein